MDDGPIDPGQRQLAERRLLAALRRHRRRSPLRPDLRVDALIAELRGAEPARPRHHRGQAALTLTDAELRRVLDGMVDSGALLRSGHRVRLPGSGPILDPVMRSRLDELIATLAAAGPLPPPAEAVASRLGLPSAMLDELRRTGDLVAVGPRIDYPARTWQEISGRLDRLAVDGAPSVKLVRDDLGVTRRHAEAVLRHWNRDRRGVE